MGLSSLDRPGERDFHAPSFPFTIPTTKKLREMLWSDEVHVGWLEHRGVFLPQTLVCQEFYDDELFKVRQAVYLVSTRDQREPPVSHRRRLVDLSAQGNGPDHDRL